MEKLMLELVQVGYPDTHSPETIKQAFNNGTPEILLINIVRWLTSQLGALLELESHISPASTDEDIIAFSVEISSFLKELGCPIKSITTGPIVDRLQPDLHKQFLLMYLCGELKAAKMWSCKKPKKEAPLKIKLEESKTAKELKEMLISLRFRKPPNTITTRQLFTELEKKLFTLSDSKSPKEMVGDLLFLGCLNEKQWYQLVSLFHEMYNEYRTRRSLLLTRLDVTVQSFLWADRLKSKAEGAKNLYEKEKSVLSIEPSVKLSDILAATTDLIIIEKTSSASVRKNTQSSVNKVLIGMVPDRGGRPEEQQPPPPEVPSWQKSDTSRSGQKSSFQQSTPQSNFAQGRGGRGKESSSHQFSQKNEGSAPRDGYIAPSYHPTECYSYSGSQQFGGFGGFGGYGGGVPAGDNFQQYGMPEVANQYAPRGSHGYGPRQRGGYSNRAGNSERGSYHNRGGYSNRPGSDAGNYFDGSSNQYRGRGRNRGRY